MWELREVSKKYGIVCNGGSRPRRAATCVVMHQTGGTSAEGAAQYLSTRPDGSVHMVVDDGRAYLTAPVSRVACGVAGANYWTIHVEMAAPFSFRLRDWRKHWQRVRRGAFHCARYLSEQGLPNDFLTTEELGHGKRDGWTFHKELSDSSASTSTHQDPVRFAKWLFRRYLAHFLRRFRRDGIPDLKVVRQ